MSTTMLSVRAEAIADQAAHVANCGGDPAVYLAIAAEKERQGRRKEKDMGGRHVRVHLPPSGRFDD